MSRALNATLFCTVLLSFLTVDVTAAKDKKNTQTNSGKSSSNSGGKKQKDSGGNNAGKNQPPAEKAAPVPLTGTLQGSAYGYLIDFDILGAPLVQGPRPYVELPPAGGTASDVAFSVNEPGLIASPNMTVLTSGILGTTHATADSVSIIDQLDFLAGLVTADQVVSFSSSLGDGVAASSSSDGTEFVGLRVAGAELGDVTPPANTAVPLPGLGILMFNRQVAGGNGRTTTALSVQAILVVLDPALSDAELLEDLVDSGIVDRELIADLLGNLPLDASLLSELNQLGIVGGNLLGLIQTIFGGNLTVAELNNLLGIDLIDQLLERDALDSLLAERFEDGVLDSDVLQRLIEDDNLGPVLAFVLDELGALNGGQLDTSLFEDLVDEGSLTIATLREFIEAAEFDLSIPSGELSGAFAHSGLDVQPPSGSPPGPIPPGSLIEIHGVGKLGSGNDQAQFGIHVRAPGKKGNGASGHVHYQDSFAGIKLQSKTITAAAFDPKSNAVTFSGVGEVNGVGNHQYTIVARDVAHHGKGRDTFSITMKGSAGKYQRNGALSAGNLHLHPGK